MLYGFSCSLGIVLCFIKAFYNVCSHVVSPPPSDTSDGICKTRHIFAQGGQLLGYRFKIASSRTPAVVLLLSDIENSMCFK
jgi:hypothetical protein